MPAAAAVSNAAAGCAVSPFELGWASGNWTRAEFTIAADTVRLAIPELAEVPTQVRYAWEVPAPPSQFQLLCV